MTTARKANKGHSPLELMEDIVPGSFIMVDIVANPTTSSITAAAYFPYYLANTDVASRFFVPLGLKDQTADSVYQALQEWATSFGPNAEFNLYMLTYVHADFDSGFTTSSTLRDVVRHYNIKISFAAPRSQHQNGIHDGNWKNVRNLAFAMMNQARVPMKFFQKYAQPHVKEEYDIDLHNNTIDSQNALLPAFIRRHNTTSDDLICIDRTSLNTSLHSLPQPLGEE
jgi:hypothetical protein